MTADEIAACLNLRTTGRSKAHHADVTKAILGIDPDNSVEDVNVRTIRLEYGKDKPRESISFPAFKYMELIEQDWEDSDLRATLLKPFLFVVFGEESAGGRRVLVAAKLWRMPEVDLEGDVRSTWEETVQRVRDGRADQPPKISESRICHVRPHGRDSRDTLPTPRNRPLVKKCLWLGRAYVAPALRTPGPQIDSLPTGRESE